MEGLSLNSDGSALGLSSRCRTPDEAIFMYRTPRKSGLPFLKSGAAMRVLVAFSSVRLLRQVSNKSNM